MLLVIKNNTPQMTLFFFNVKFTIEPPTTRENQEVQKDGLIALFTPRPPKFSICAVLAPIVSIERFLPS